MDKDLKPWEQLWVTQLEWVWTSQTKSVSMRWNRCPPRPRPLGPRGFVYHNLADLLLSSLSSEEFENKTRSSCLKYDITQQYHDQILQRPFVCLIMWCMNPSAIRPRQIKIIMRAHKSEQMFVLTLTCPVPQDNKVLKLYIIPGPLHDLNPNLQPGSVENYRWLNKHPKHTQSETDDDNPPMSQMSHSSPDLLVSE